MTARIIDISPIVRRSGKCREVNPAAIRAAHEEVLSAFERLGIRASGEDQDELGYTHRVDTRAGVLRLRVSDPRLSSFLTVFGRFEEPGRAARHVSGVNPFTGKWNHHFLDDYQGRDIAALFEDQIRPLLV